VFATETSPCAHDGEDDTQTSSMIQTAVMWRRPSDWLGAPTRQVPAADRDLPSDRRCRALMAT
jgi:hypothetical protein